VINLIDNLVLHSDHSLDENLDAILKIAAQLPVTHKQTQDNNNNKKALTAHVVDLNNLFERVKAQGRRLWPWMSLLQFLSFFSLLWFLLDGDLLFIHFLVGQSQVIFSLFISLFSFFSLFSLVHFSLL
jgi:hypothetical protein